MGTVHTGTHPAHTFPLNEPHQLLFPGSYALLFFMGRLYNHLDAIWSTGLAVQNMLNSNIFCKYWIDEGVISRVHIIYSYVLQML